MHNYCFFGTFPIRLARRDKISPCRPNSVEGTAWCRRTVMVPMPVQPMLAD